VVLAAGAHPDDIEFMMAGTLLLLASKGADLHLLNLANGCCGTKHLSKEEIVRIRSLESREAAKLLNAKLHPPLADDGLIFYDQPLLCQVAALVRRIRPRILLVPSPEDYMEDHQNTSRLLVTGAFVRGMRNFPTNPPQEPTDCDVTIYHAMPYALRDGMRRRLRPEIYVNIASVLKQKESLLACHKSQKNWLDFSQGIDAYLHQMVRMSTEVGEMSRKFECAEGWRRHSHLGFSALESDPLSIILADYSWTDPAYQESLG
jgi:LmbE family N-acetylglucosaminyl deacetylase